MSAKPIIFLILVFIFLSFISPLPLAGSWNGWIYQNPYPTSNTLLAVKFVTPKKGWVAGELGTILYTEDGGENWEVQESGTEEDLMGVSFINEKSGWSVGEWGAIIHTEDGGKTWSQQTDAKAILKSVFFINDKVGWVAGMERPEGKTGIKGLLLHTTDGGKKWERLDIDIQQRSIASVYFINSQVGWLLAGDEVYRTEDGGKTWEKSRLPLELPMFGSPESPLINMIREEPPFDLGRGRGLFC
jgi:photosystem II stability/assembly factor-like uncharacterized protein